VKPDAYTKAQKTALDAAMIIVSFIGSALGPRGAEKMLIQRNNFVKPVMVTKDGHEALNRMEVEHPVAKLLVEAGKWMDFTVGDGSISAILLSGALLRRAEELMKKEIHPSIIADGYAMAQEKAQEIMKEIAQKFDPEDRESVLKLARTCLETKLPADDAAFLAPMVADAVQKVKAYNQHGLFIDPDQIDVVTKVGGTLRNSELINGIAMWREPTRYWMPYDIHDAKIAFIAEELVHRLLLMSPLFKPEIQITSPEQMKTYRDEEVKILMDKAMLVLKTGANVIVSAKTYDDHVQVALGRLGIMAIRRAMPADIARLAKATGGKIIAEIVNLTPQDLGYAEHIYVKPLQGDNWIFFEGCKDPKAVTIIVMGSSANVSDAAGSAIKNAIHNIDRAARDPAVFPGGGSLEAEIAGRLKRWAYTLHGRQQLAVLKYAEALETIPTMLAESCGMNPLDAMLKIRSEHAKGSTWFGIDVVNMRLADMQDGGVIDTKAVKSQVLKTATEVAITMIKVDGLFTQPKRIPKRKAPGPGSKRHTAIIRDADYRPPAEVRRFMQEAW